MTTPATSKDLFAQLKKPFRSTEIEWKIANMNKERTRGRALPYLKFKAVADRLDDVLGEENWVASYVTGPAGGVVCRLSVRINGEWLCKENGAGNTEQEGVKGGLTDSFKRAATMWGIGRYLHAYDAIHVDIDTNTGHFQPPALPDSLLPSEEVEEQRQAFEQAQREAEALAAAAATEVAKTPAKPARTAKASKAKDTVSEETPAQTVEFREVPPESAAESVTQPESQEDNGAQGEPQAQDEPAATAAVEEVPAESPPPSETLPPPADVQAGPESTELSFDEQGKPIKPEGLPEAQTKRIDQLVDRIYKDVPLNVISEYVQTEKAVGSMMEIARKYILALIAYETKVRAPA